MASCSGIRHVNCTTETSRQHPSYEIVNAAPLWQGTMNKEKPSNREKQQGNCKAGATAKLYDSATQKDTAKETWQRQSSSIQAKPHASVPIIIFFRVIRKDIDDLYKWPTYWPKGLHQSQILHADNNTTIIHDINMVYIDIIRSVCSIINYGWGFVSTLIFANYITVNNRENAHLDYLYIVR